MAASEVLVLLKTAPSLEESSVKTELFALPSASKVAPAERVSTPFKFWLLSTCMGATPLVTEMLLKVVIVLPWIFCVELPFNTNVPVLALNVPLLVKLLVTSSVAGLFRTPEIVMLAKLVVEEPPIEDVPLNTTVLPLLLNVPLFVKVPATFIELAPPGAVSVPEMITLSNEEV